MTDEELKVIFADLLIRIRERNNLARKELARMLYVSPSLIANYENKYQAISPTTIEFTDKLTHHLKLTEEETTALFDFRVDVMKKYLSIDTISDKTLAQMEYEAAVSIGVVKTVMEDRDSHPEYGTREKITLVLMLTMAYRRILIIALQTGNLTPAALHGAFQTLEEEMNSILKSSISQPPSQSLSQPPHTTD